jgi:hypothetical protein
MDSSDDFGAILISRLDDNAISHQCRLTHSAQCPQRFVPPFFPVSVGWTGEPSVIDRQKATLKTRNISLTLARCGLTLVRSPPVNLVPVLVPVRTEIRFISMQHHAI